MNRIRKVEIEFIPHDQQRYATVGDWQMKDNGETLLISVSQMPDNRHEMLVAVHELVEVLLCRENGVTQEMVDQFDIAYEANRKEGDLSEPGDDVKSPYRTEHCFATSVERMLCAAWLAPWADYENAVNSLP